MKKTTIKTKLVLRNETTRVLLEKNLAQVGAGHGSNEVEKSVGGTTCVGATQEPR